MGTTGHCYAAAGRPEVAKAVLERLESAQVRAPGNDLSRLVAKLHQGFAAQAGGDGLNGFAKAGCSSRFPSVQEA